MHVAGELNLKAALPHRIRHCSFCPFTSPQRTVLGVKSREFGVRRTTSKRGEKQMDEDPLAVIRSLLIGGTFSFWAWIGIFRLINLIVGR